MNAIGMIRAESRKRDIANMLQFSLVYMESLGRAIAVLGDNLTALTESDSE